MELNLDFDKFKQFILELNQATNALTIPVLYQKKTSNLFTSTNSSDVFYEPNLHLTLNESIKNASDLPDVYLGLVVIDSKNKANLILQNSFFEFVLNSITQINYEFNIHRTNIQALSENTYEFKTLQTKWLSLSKNNSISQEDMDMLNQILA